MNEVNEFLSKNPDMGTEFQSFAAQYATLADVWENCPRSNWMLWLLYKHNYRNGEKLESYIDSLSEQIDDIDENELERTRQRHFNYKGYIGELEKERETGRLSQHEVMRRRFIWTWLTARHATQFILDSKVARIQFNNWTEKFLMAEAGVDFQVADFDETEVRLTLLKEQADKLRETMGNPFEFLGTDDFY
jgi:hypothetical protein